MCKPESDLATKKKKIYTISMAGISLAMILAVQLIRLPNLITGIAINSIFVVVNKRVGFHPALFIGLLSPFGAMISGHLPPILYPITPIIVTGNITFIFIYAILRNKHIFARVIIPSICKALIISGIGHVIINQLHIAEKAHWLIFSVLGFQIVTATLGIILGEQLLKLIFTNENIT